jgi:N-acyl-D-aspartate/D-glutamate deacylase
MGDRGADLEPATAADIAAMATIAQHAVEAGALGFSTSRTVNHRTSDGKATPSLRASEAELHGIALGLARAAGGEGRGVLQFVSDFTDPDSEFAMLRRIVEQSRRPLSFSLVQHNRSPENWKLLLDRLAAANAAGLPMKAQVCGRPVGILFSLELTLHPFSHHPSYRTIARLPLVERVQRLRDPAFRAQLLSEVSKADRGFAATMPRNWPSMFLMGDEPDYEQPPEQSVAALALARKVTPEELALDHMLSNEGRGMLYLPFLNYSEGSLDPSYAMLNDPNTVPGLSDGGAHVGMICDASFPTSNLTHWTRDRTRGPKLSVEQMVHMQTRNTAEAVCLFDRGILAAGYRADLNIIDYDRLALLSPEVAYDLPTGGRRLMQQARGYVATIVAGEVTYRDGQPTQALPGRIVRGPQRVPALAPTVSMQRGARG